jgi:RNA polymerase sigma-70 factor (ECF subfamily)
MSTFEELYRNNVRMVFAVALSRSGETAQAEDLTQETFLRAWRGFVHLHDLAPPAQRAWLLTALRNLATDLWRKQARENQELAWHTTDLLVPEPEDTEARLEVIRALDALPSGDREIVVLRFVMEMNSREIGEVLEMPEGTVRRRLAICRRKLAQGLDSWAPGGKIHGRTER